MVVFILCIFTVSVCRDAMHRVSFIANCPHLGDAMHRVSTSATYHKFKTQSVAANRVNLFPDESPPWFRKESVIKTSRRDSSRTTLPAVEFVCLYLYRSLIYYFPIYDLHWSFCAQCYGCNIPFYGPWHNHCK